MKSPYIKPPMPQAREVDQTRARNIALDGAEYVTVELRNVPTRGLRASQRTVNCEHVDRLSQIPRLPPIHVVRFGRRYLIVDGHHRSTLEILNNAPSIMAWVYTPTRSKKR